MFFSNKEDFNRWIGYMHSYKYMIVGYMWKPIIFFVDVPIDLKINKKENEKCQDQ